METIVKTKQEVAYNKIVAYLNKCNKHLFVDKNENPYRVIPVDIINNETTEKLVIEVNIVNDKPSVYIREVNKGVLDENSLFLLRTSLFGGKSYKSVKRRKKLEAKFSQLKELVAKEYVWGMSFNNKQLFKTKLEALLQ